MLGTIDPAGDARLTQNHPAQLNARSHALLAPLSDTSDTLDADPTVRVLTLPGAGKALCAGLDLKESGSDQAALGAGDSGVTPRDPVAALQHRSGPVIGGINGAAVTAISS